MTESLSPVSTLLRDQVKIAQATSASLSAVLASLAHDARRVEAGDGWCLSVHTQMNEDGGWTGWLYFGVDTDDSY